MASDAKPTFQMCVCGPPGSGKTNVIFRLVRRPFETRPYETSGFRCHDAEFTTPDGVRIAAEYYDMPKDDTFWALHNVSFSNLCALIVVFDGKDVVYSDGGSLVRAAHDNTTVPVFVVLNKVDEESDADSRETAYALSKQQLDEPKVLRCAYTSRVFKVSAKTGAGFDALKDEILAVMRASHAYQIAHWLASRVPAHAPLTALWDADSAGRRRPACEIRADEPLITVVGRRGDYGVARCRGLRLLTAAPDCSDAAECAPSRVPADGATRETVAHDDLWP